MDTLAFILHTTSTGVLIGLVCWVAFLWFQIVLDAITDWLAQRRRRRIARIEADLDARAEELRRTILALAEQLAAERDAVSARMASAAAVANSTTAKSLPPGSVGDR